MNCKFATHAANNKTQNAAEASVTFQSESSLNSISCLQCEQKKNYMKTQSYKPGSNHITCGLKSDAELVFKWIFLCIVVLFVFALFASQIQSIVVFKFTCDRSVPCQNVLIYILQVLCTF